MHTYIHTGAAAFDRLVAEKASLLLDPLPYAPYLQHKQQMLQQGQNQPQQMLQQGQNQLQQTVQHAGGHDVAVHQALPAGRPPLLPSLDDVGMYVCMYTHMYICM